VRKRVVGRRRMVGEKAGGVWLAALDEVGCETDGQRKANINMAWMTAKHPLHKHALNGLVHDNDFIVRGVAREHDARSRASLTSFLLSFTTEAVLVIASSRASWPWP